MSPTHYQALLLVGPTGSGKTPLGHFLQKNGLWGKRCVHFDFGHQLRNIGNRVEKPPYLKKEEMAIIAHSLKTGVLLEDDQFPIAKKILLSFIKSRNVTEKDLVVLNGLPRHRGQAKDLESIITIKRVVYLECSPKVVWNRIRFNSGGDRSLRTDDSFETVRKRWHQFNERTLPLLDYYRTKNIRIVNIKVAVDTKPENIHDQLLRQRL